MPRATDRQPAQGWHGRTARQVAGRAANWRGAWRRRLVDKGKERTQPVLALSRKLQLPAAPPCLSHPQVFVAKEQLSLDVIAQYNVR